MKKESSDIEEIDKRIRNLKEKQQKSGKDNNASPIKDAVANAFRIGTEFIAAVLVGICIGFTLDKIFGTKVVFLLVLSLFGCMAGMLNVYRSAQEMDKNIQKGKD